MHDIFLLVHDDVGQETRLQAAVDVARTIGGHLTCLGLTIPIAIPVDTIVFEGSVAVADHDAQLAHSAKIRARVKETGLPFTWLERTEGLECALEKNSFQSDLIVLSLPGDAPLFDLRHAIGRALVEERKAVLAVPTHSRGMKTTGDVIVAWDGSQEAMSALHAAMPMLRHAKSIVILELDDGSLDRPAATAADYLQQHELPVRVQTDLTCGRKAGYVLLEHLRLFQPDYLVMGGYGHSRIVESIFGGVTDRMLTESPVPLFIKH